jgi:type IV pilus assembly protein PilF
MAPSRTVRHQQVRMTGGSVFFGNSVFLVTVMLLVLCLGGCVTETTGGFNVERSDEQALSDYIQLATGYLEQNDLANAKRHLENAARYDSNNSEVMAIWGLVYSKEGEDDLADESFRRSLRINSGNSKARNNYAAFLFAIGRYQDAFDQLQRVVQDTEYPARPQAFENLGLAALRLNRAEDAENAFSRALQLNSSMLRSSLELASLNLDRNDVLQARAYYRNFLTLLQLYNTGQNARSLWTGIRLEAAMGNIDNVKRYGAMLESAFASTPEYQAYVSLLDTLEDE